MKKVFALVAVVGLMSIVGCRSVDTGSDTTSHTTPSPKAILSPTLTLDLGKGVTMEFVLIKPGSFIMGSETRDGLYEPAHQVTITKPFYMGKYEVTQEQWESLMGSNPSLFKGTKNPVEKVSWDICKVFLRALKRKCKDMDVRLPTEAEWEYACRAGSTTKYCYGDDESRLDEYAWFDSNLGYTTHPVGEKKPNAWGLYDMHGNVQEWCSDVFAFYKSTAAIDPIGPSSGWKHVIRDGSWHDDADMCHSAIRGFGDSYGNGLGLRVVVVVR